MAKNHVQKGAVMTWTNGTGSAVSSGDVVKVGDLICIALGDIADGATGELALQEVWTVAKATSLAISQGDSVYWDVADGNFNKTSTDNTYGGKAFMDAAADDTTFQIRLDN